MQDDYLVFITIIERGTLAEAARHLRRSPQAITRALSGLERSLGVELIRRTTRQTVPTDAGRRFYARIKAALAEIDRARQEAAAGAATVSGVLRVAASPLFATESLVPLIAEFLAVHPALSVELELADRFIDLVDGGIDVAVRMGELPDSSLRARRLGALRRVTFAAPAYLLAHGRPQRPQDLAEHECVIRSVPCDAGESWTYADGAGGEITVQIQGRFRSHSAAACNAAAVHGCGIGRAPLAQVRAQIADGSLEILLAEFERAPLPVYAVWPDAEVLPARTRAFVDFLGSRIALD
jgi:DNA-binding transcriptional LysR family regulator